MVEDIALVMEKRRIVRSLIIVAVGLIFAVSIWSQTLAFSLPVPLNILGFLGQTLIGIGLSYIIVEMVIWPCLEGYSQKTRTGWISVGLIVGSFLVYEIPLTVYPVQHIIRIIATGEKNVASKGSEVWLASISAGQRTPIVNLTRICKGDWPLIGDLLVSSQNQPSELVCEVKTDDDQIFVTLGMHPWSGKARLVFEGKTQEVDLYSESGDRKEVNFQIRTAENRAFIGLALFLADGISMGLIVLAISLWLITRTSKFSAQLKPGPTRWYWYTLPLAATWSIYLLAFWPGFLSPDTVYQLFQVSTGKIYDWHPAFHTMTLWLITRLWFSPAAVSIVQILILSTLIGWGMSLIQKSGASAWLTWPVIFFLAISPASSLIVLTLWKDVAFGIAILALTLLTFQILRSDGRWIEKSTHWITFAVVIALSALYRHNGAPVAFGTLGCILLIYRRQCRPLLAAAVLALVLWAGVRGPLYQFTGVNTTEPALGRNIGVEARAFAIAYRHYLSGTLLNPEERDLILKIYQQNQVDLKALSIYSKEVDQLAIQLTLRDPAPTLDYLLQQSTFVFQILQPPRRRTEYVGLDLYKNPFGLELDSKLPRIKNILTDLAEKTEVPKWDWLIWRNAFWMYLLIWSTIVACARSCSWKYSLILAPVLLNALPLSIFTGGQLARYILPTLLISPIFSGYLLLIQQKHSVSNSDPRSDILNRLD